MMSYIEEEKSNLDSTGYDCAICDKPNYNNSQMVYCTICKHWFHFSCVGVTDEVKDFSWHCEACRNNTEIQSTAEGTQHSSDSILDIVDLGYRKNELWIANEKEQEEADRTHKRNLELMKEIKLENIRRELQRQEQQRLAELELEREILEMKRLADVKFQKLKGKLAMECGGKKAVIDNAVGGKVSHDDAKRDKLWKDSTQNPVKQKQQSISADHRGAYPKNATPVGTELLCDPPSSNLGTTPVRDLGMLPEKGIGKPPMLGRKGVKSQQPSLDYHYSSSVESDSDNNSNYVGEPLEQLGANLTKAHLAARKGPFQKLPIFTGRPEEWPMFFSSWRNSNEACNWSNLENLGRLQESIRGAALEVVRSRLLLPETVPAVIETLKNLYGRPEFLLQTLVMKARKAEPPRIDRLQTFIKFGIIVQQLSDHLIAAGLQDHLVNPMLIQELVDKVPSSTKLEWVRYKRQHDEVTLATFAEFLSGIVSDASEVTLFAEMQLDQGSRDGKDKREQKRREKQPEGFLHTHIGEDVQRSDKTGVSVTQGQSDRKSKAHEEIRKPCRICNRTDHRIRYCEEFRILSWDQRMKEVNRWRLCNICLNEHGQSRCRFKTKCNIGSCEERHHPLLHPPNKQRYLTPVITDCNAHNLQSNQPVLFRMVPVRLTNGKRFVDVLAFLDGGASYSLVEQEVADKIKLEGLSQPILVKWTAGMTRLERDSKSVNLSISGRDSRMQFALKNVHTVNRLELPEQTLDYSAVAAKYRHLKGLPVSDYRNGSPKILIGLKHLHVYAPLESRIGNVGEPIAVRTHLGWTVYGPHERVESLAGFGGHHVVHHAVDLELHELLRSHYVLEESGISVTMLPESADDRRARELLEKTTVRMGDRYETGLLWKEDHPQLPDSYPMAVKRMKNLEKKLSKNPELQINVSKQIEQYVEKRYAHKITAQDLEEAIPGKVWYLPLNVVLNPKKPKKVRLVWDVAAAVQGTSLNSALLKGPDLLTNLPVVLYHFRERPVAFRGDIMEMYHQIGIQRNDRQSQRFLYRHDPSGQPQIYVMDVATFGSTSSPCSAQYVKNRNAREFADQFPDAVEAIVDKHYVDDYLDSTYTVDQAVKRAIEVRFIHSKAGFHIRNWVSNSTVFLGQLGEAKTDKLVHFISNKTTTTERVLGVSWDPSEDVFVFSTKLRSDLEPFTTGSQRPTKRQVSSCVMSFFDPHGYLAPFTIHGKLIIQDLWRLGCSWDEMIDDESATKWDRWTAAMPAVDAFKIPRCYFFLAKTQDHETLQLHVFADASENAYGCVAYLRAVINGQPWCALVTAKTKVAPLQHLSIPRLELLAAVLGARLSQSIKAGHSLRITRTILWIDSRTVLAWIQSDHRRYKQFVAFRIGEILSQTGIDDWRWVPSKMNSADVLTKWKPGQPLDSNGEYVKGPDFLYRPEQYWPPKEIVSPNPKEELRAVHFFHEIVLRETLVDTTRFSSWNVLVRTVACIFRFATNCRRKKLGRQIAALPASSRLLRTVNKPLAAVVTPLVREEYCRAENVLWRAAQQEVFGDEVKILIKNRNLPPEKWHPLERCSPLFKLSPMLDENDVIRMEGRSAHAEFVSFGLRFPIILPKNHDVTKKLLMFYHRKFGHANRETVVNEVRQRFYVPNLRAAVLQVTKECIRCRINKCCPKFPRMAPLPDQRLTPKMRPFSFVGIDYFGPINVTVGRRIEKRWVALMTCLTTRAVHLEVAHSLSSQACIMAIRRFMCRRGVPLEFFSDNGTNFQVVSKEFGLLGRQIDVDCAEAFTDARTQWHFNPPSAPHMGGSWERLVRSAKETMKGLDDGRRLTDEVLLTVLAETEEMMNSRPLTYVPQESAEVEALTPNHFLRGLPSDERKLEPIAINPAEALRDQFKRSQQLADVLWQRWVREYIPTVNQRTKWYGNCEPIVEGDLVFITDGRSRRAWTRGVVERLIRGRDGRVRQAMVRTNRRILRRAVSKLAVLELECKSGQGIRPGPELQAGELLAPLHSADLR